MKEISKPIVNAIFNAIAGHGYHKVLQDLQHDLEKSLQNDNQPVKEEEEVTPLIGHIYRCRINDISYKVVDFCRMIDEDRNMFLNGIVVKSVDNDNAITRVFTRSWFVKHFVEIDLEVEL